MLATYRVLFAHQEWADRALLDAVRAHPGAMDDEELLRLLHHVAVVQRAYLGILWGRPFDREKESQPAATFEALEERFREAHAAQADHLGRLEESELDRMVDVPMMRGMKFPVSHGLLQVVMHSQAHRAQCLARLRVLGAKPPILDFILWVKDRLSPQ